ncbi:phosphatidylserine decarboxylase [Verrucomicrobia bacterium]|nr:phosphatidylserine decarboxylase [Verrucomicrobiota bacterium]
MIAAEGKIILLPVILLALTTTGVSIYTEMGGSGLKGVNILLWIFILFSLYFFRDPLRIPMGEPNQMVSPADGKVVQILDIEDPDIGKAKQISIFLSVFNVHCQRVPLSGKVISSFYNSGKFLAAFNHKASIDNEQTSILFETDSSNRYKVKQIAGLIARRILNYMEPEMIVEKGQRLGFIRFGSRVDIIVPSNFKINVSLGDIVQGNRSIMGEFE